MGRAWGILWLAVILGLLTGCDISAQGVVVTTVTTQKATSACLELPQTLPESGLILEEFRTYSGPYWEDGSGDLVENVACVMVYNPSERMVEYAALAVEQGEDMLYFFIYALPPQSRCLVMEYNRKSSGTMGADAVREVRVKWEYQEFSREQIDYLGLGPNITIINRDGRTIGTVAVRYKRYIQEGDYYLGGSVYTKHLLALMPEERRTVRAEHYDAGHARIVSITLEI